jgi:hypothetical protein
MWERIMRKEYRQQRINFFVQYPEIGIQITKSIQRPGKKLTVLA